MKNKKTLIVIMITLGCVLYGATIMSIVQLSTSPLTRFAVPGEITLNFNNKGLYGVYYEYRSELDGKVYLTGKSLNKLKVNLKNLNSEELIPIKSASNAHYTFGNRAANLIMEFDIKSPGKYVMKVDYENSSDNKEIVLAIINRGYTFLVIFIGTIASLSFIITGAYIAKKNGYIKKKKV